MHSIREEPAAESAVNDAHARWPRAEDAWEAVTWVLAHDPEVGQPLGESGRLRAFTFEGARSVGMPTVTVVYECLPALVVVHDARFVDAGHANAGRA